MRWVLALAVVSLLCAPMAYGGLQYSATAQAVVNFGSGQLVFSDTDVVGNPDQVIGDNVELFKSALVFTPADNLGQIPDDTTINAQRDSCSLSIFGGNFNLQEVIAGINVFPAYSKLRLSDTIDNPTPIDAYGPGYCTADLTVNLSHVSGFDTALVMTNTYAIQSPGYDRGEAIVLKGNDVGVAGNGTHFVFANGTSGIDTTTCGNGIISHMFVVNNGVPDFAVPVAAGAFGASAQEIVGLSQTAIPRADSFYGTSQGNTTDHVLLADGSYAATFGTVASLQLSNVPVLDMGFNPLNVSSGNMIVTGAGTTTITGGGSITSTNATSGSSLAGGVSLNIYNTSNLIWDTGCNSNVTLLGSGTITFNQAPSGNIYWLHGSMVWNNDSDCFMTGNNFTASNSDGGSLTKNGIGTLKMNAISTNNAIDDLAGMGNIYVNGGMLWLSGDGGNNGNVTLGPLLQVNTGGTLRIGDYQVNYRGMHIAPGTVVQLSGGTLYCQDWLSTVPVIDIPAGTIGNVSYIDPSGGGHSNFAIPTLTGSGTLRITSPDNTTVLSTPNNPTYAGWVVYGACVSLSTGAGSAFTGDVDVANNAVLDLTSIPSGIKSLVVENGGYALAGSWGGAVGLTLTNQSLRGNGIVSMTGDLTATQGLSTLTVSGGQVSPGLASSVGKLTVIGNLALSGSSALNIRVTGSNAVAGADYDQLVSQENYSGATVAITGLANSVLHVNIGTNLALKGDVLTIVSAVGGTGATGTLQDFTGSAFGSVVFDNYAVADVNYGPAAITLSRLATAGDITRNGFVDGGDLNILLSNWNFNDGAPGVLTYAYHDIGDASHNGVVDGGDLNIILSNWNAGIAGQGVGTAPAPEPMTLTLVALGAAC